MQSTSPKSLTTFYAPWSDGEYRVAAGLEPLERLGAYGEWDTRVFQISDDWPRYRKNYEGARTDDLSKYHGTGDMTLDQARAVHRFMAERMVAEYPEHFRLTADANGIVLACGLTGDTLRFDDAYDWSGELSEYASGLDALTAQLPEDIAVTSVSETDDRLAAAHVTAPSHWDPREKLGQNFVEIHEPVAGIEKVNAKAPALMRAIATGGAFRRYGWSITTDDRLNHHPDPPTWFEGDADSWRGRPFDLANPKLYARVERQVLIGLPEVDTVIFLIRVYTYDVAALTADSRSALCAALRSMPTESIRYKGLGDNIDTMIEWLEKR